MNKKTLDHIEIINNLMTHEDWYQKDVYELLQKGVDITANAGVSFGLKAGATAVAGATAQATVVNSIALSTAAFTAPVVGGVAGLYTVGKILMKIADIYGNEKKYIKEVGKHAERALKDIMIYCFKDEVCPDKIKGGGALKIGTDLNEYRENKAFLAWIDLQTFKIMGEEYVESNGLLKIEDELSEEEKKQNDLEDETNSDLLQSTKEENIQLIESFEKETDFKNKARIQLKIRANNKIIEELEQATLINIKCPIQREYERKINEYIKPDQRKRFEEEMKTFCAANKILADYKYKDLNFEPSLKCAGEFSKSKANSSSPFFSRESWRNWWRDEQGKEQKIYQDDLKAILNSEKKISETQDDEGISKKLSKIIEDIKTNYMTKKTFNDLRKKFYGAYKATMYAHCHEITDVGGIDIRSYAFSLYYKALYEALGIDPEKPFLKLDEKEKAKLTQFNRLFRQYRYIGGECEYNAHDFFKMRLFDKFYEDIKGAKGDLISIKSQLKRQLKQALYQTTLTIAVGCIAGIYHHNQIPIKAQHAKIKECEDALKALQDSGCSDFSKFQESVGLKAQAKMKVPGAKEKWNFLQEQMKNFKYQEETYARFYQPPSGPRSSWAWKDTWLDIMTDPIIDDVRDLNRGLVYETRTLNLLNQPDHLIRQVLENVPPSQINLTKVVKDPVSLEWIKNVLKGIEEIDKRQLVNGV